jgi:hypothetical protein
MTQRSHITQVMQNYFDATDVRSRANPTALENQLLNLAAIELEDLNMRLDREVTQTIQNVPTNIDNQGVYYSLPIPSSVIISPTQTSFNSVVTTIDDISTTLSLYDDKLPAPTRIEIDTPNTVELSNPLMFTAIGQGDDLAQAYAVQYVNPGNFPIPNKLTLWADQLGSNEIDLRLTIIGETFPQPAWVAERKKTTEILEITEEGVAYTRNRWATIDSIAIRNLPTGVRVRGWSMPFNLPACPDIARPYTTIEDRDILYNRYWQIVNNESLLYEVYNARGLTGLEPVNSYAISNVLVDVAVEPFTNGMFLASDSVLYYADRREFYADLATTGISAEPLYGLQVQYDFDKPGPTRYVTISGTPYANSDNIFQYRYTVLPVDSLNVRFSILPDGSIGPSDSGWRGGAPQTVSFALTDNIDYEFRLEMQDINGATTYDIRPFKNAALTPMSSIDLSVMVDSIQGLAFDSYGQLWIWNGSFALPVLLHYDAYLFDPESKTLFATEPFDSIIVT